MRPLQTFLFRAGLSLLIAAAMVSAASAQTLKGSRASVDLMYTTAHTHDLAFLKTPDDVYSAAESGALELISITGDLTLDRAKFPFVLPNTKRFVDSLAAKYRAGCGERLVVTSGARPIDEQPRNASPESVHPTGMAVDIHKPAEPCLTWLRKSLLALENAHVIEATEEKHPPHFHVAVLRQLREPPIRALASSKPALGSSTPNSPATASRASSTSASGDVSLASTNTTYRVRAGDNLWTIAERHNMTVDDLKKLNGLKSSRLKVGTELKLR
jgi:LysM repeat protein